jgi:hypothetical protein
MQELIDLGTVRLTIPAWQAALYLCAISFAVIFGRIKGILLATYLSAFYWGYYLYGGDFLTAAHGNPAAQAVYYGFALALGGCILMALFHEER